MMKAAALLVLACVCAVIAPSAYSQIVKCRAESGQLVYTEEKCPAGTQPLDLDKTLPSSARASPTQASRTAAEPVLTPRAQELKALVFACVHSGNTGCNEYQQLYRSCTDRNNRGTQDCKALVQLLPLAKQEGFERILRDHRASCRQQDSDDCRRSTCTVLPAQEPDDDQLHACAKAWGFPSTKSWALISETKDEAGNWTGIYVCFPKHRFLGSVGEPTWQRGQIVVEAQMSGGRPTGSFIGMGWDLQASREAAAEAGCARRNAHLGERAKRDAAALKAGS